MSLETDAAIAKISVNSSLLKSDPLLTLILSIIPSGQADVIITTDTQKPSGGKGGKSKGKAAGGKKGSKQKKNQTDEPSTPPTPPASSGPLSLTTNGGKTTLTSRNAVLRSLCGMALHNRLDSRPPYLLGGYSASSAVSRSPEAAFVMAGITSWMSVAGTVRGDDAGDLTETCGGLDGVLAGRAFLCGDTVGSPTVADLDVFFALTDALGKAESTPSAEEGKPNLQRWMRQCAATVGRLVDGIGPAGSDLPAVEVPEVKGAREVAPRFVYDASGVVPVVEDAAAAAPSAAAPAGVTDEQKEIAVQKRAALKAKKDAKRKEAAAAAAAQEGTSSDDKSKNNKPAKTKKQPTPPANSDYTISALDIRIGKILSVELHPSSDKLYVEQVDVGEPQPRQILSGLRPFLTMEEMKNQGYVLVLCNLKERKLAGVPSHGMVLCASNSDHTAVEFVVPALVGGEATVGEKVVFEGHEEGGEPEPENKIGKKKIFEKLAPDFRTDGDGVVVWKGGKSKTSNGPCVAMKGMKEAMVA